MPEHNHHLRAVAGLLAALLLPGALCAEEGDWGYAQNLFIKKTIAGKWSLVSRSQFALRDDLSDLFYGFADVGLGYQLLPAWRVDAVYRRVWIQPDDEWLVENVPLINLNWLGQWGNLRLSNRLRLEFREYTWDKEDDIRLRNETGIELPWAVLPGGIRPYFEEEFFYGRNSEQIEMNWLTGGLFCKPAPTVKLKAGYRWVAARQGDEWENRNQLVTGLYLFY